MRLRHLIVLALFTALAACGGGGGKFTVIGNVSGLPDDAVFLEEVNMDGVVIIDSANADEAGKFELSGTASEPRLYRLRFSGNRFVLLSMHEGNVNVKADWNTIENYELSGSESSESLKQLLMVIRGHMNDLNQMQTVLDTLHARGDTAKLRTATADAVNLKVSLTRHLEEYADTTRYLPNAIFAAQILNPEAEGQFMQAFVQNLPARFKDSKLAQEFIDKYNQMMTNMGNQQAAAAGPAIGNPAPEISLQTPDGKTVTLSSLRGKYVLVDFWASWCGPCRQENPNVVKAYNAFKGKNFTILGVSLDEDKDKWLKAIEKDKLTWPHISDLKGWQSLAARDYNVNSIPANFLVDPAGNIIAANLRGEELTAKLSEVLNGAAAQ